MIINVGLVFYFFFERKKLMLAFCKKTNKMDLEKLLMVTILSMGFGKTGIK